MTEITTDQKAWWPQKICSEVYFKRVIAATHTAYLTGGRKLPDVRAIATYMGRAPKIGKIAAVLGTPEFKSAMATRGINWSGKTLGITPEQTYALQIMTDPSHAHKQFQTRLKLAGTTYLKWSSWMKEPLFRSAFQSITESNIDESVGVAHTALLSRVAAGDMRAIEFYYRISGRFDPDREANMNMQAILLSILEILTRRITDETLLEAISSDMEKVIQGEVVSHPISISNDNAAPVGKPPTVFSFEH